MITKVASQASWRFLKDVIWSIKGFMGRFNNKVTFMINSLPHHHKVHNEYWRFKEEYEDHSWRIKMEKLASQATQEYIWCYYVKTHIEFCYMLWRFTSTINNNGNDAYVEDRQNLLKVLSYQSFSRWESLRIIFHEFSKEFMYKA
jgi:hypothetical protein